MFKKPGVLILLACLPACLLADFSYEQSTKVTGGMMAGAMKFVGAFSKQAREPVQSTVAVKGNRMFHGNKDRASVIDLDNETITEINYQKKIYSVMTFAEMKQAMEQAMQRMKDAPKQPPQQDSMIIKAWSARRQAYRNGLVRVPLGATTVVKDMILRAMRRKVFWSVERGTRAVQV